MKPDIDMLLAKYFAGEATGKEQALLEQWIGESEENQAYFDELTDIFKHTVSLANPEPAPNMHKARAEFEDYMKASASEVRKEPIIGKKKRWSIDSFYWITAAACMTLLISLSIIRFIGRASRPIEHIATSASTQFALPDSTSVTLSPNSQLSYKKDFGESRKVVELVGEASFAVSSSDGDGKKLLVFAGETIIEDIGTVFKVSAFPDSSKVMVSVTEGKVHVYTKTSEGIVIEANEVAIFDNATKTFTKRELSITPINNLHFEFSSTSMSDVAKLLSKAYGVRLVFGDKSIADRKITVTFDNEDVDFIIAVISETLDVDVTKNQSVYTLF